MPNDTPESGGGVLADAIAALRHFASHVGKSGSKVTLTIGNDTWTGTLTTKHFEQASAVVRAFNEAPAPPVDDRMREALTTIGRPKYGLQGIQEDYGHDTNAYNFHAMNYYRDLAHHYEQLARAALGTTGETD